jgi:DNA polymerase III epsilon subunit-like protein
MSGLVYYIVDTETTGLSAVMHELCEISIIRCSDRVQLTEFVRCDYPERANYDALMITGKTLTDLEYGSSKEEAVSKVNKFLNQDGLTPAHRCFVAHNYTFDKRFIHALYDKVSQRCPVDLWLCTMAMTKQYAKQIGLVKPKVNLHAACDIVGVKKISHAHASKVDSRNTYLLHQNLIEDKKIDYLPFIKTAIHSVSATEEDDERADPALLDL